MGPSRLPNRATCEKKLLAALFRVFQFAVMSDVAAGFYRKAEGPRGLLAPAGNRLGRRQAIEAVIDLDGVKLPGAPAEHLRRRQIEGIKRPPPVLVVPTGRANVDQPAD